jgi:hypothetical protein
MWERVSIRQALFGGKYSSLGPDAAALGSTTLANPTSNYGAFTQVLATYPQDAATPPTTGQGTSLYVSTMQLKLSVVFGIEMIRRDILKPELKRDRMKLAINRLKLEIYHRFST